MTDQVTHPTSPATAQSDTRQVNQNWFTRHKALTGAGAAAVVVAAAGIGVAIGDHGAPAASGPEVSGSSEIVAEASDVSPEGFQEISPDEWNGIAKSPEAAQGDAVVVYAEVTQFDSATGADTFRANVGAEQPTGEYELETNTVLTGDETALSGIVTGDVLEVRATVAGALDYETQIGGSTTVPQLAVVSVDEVGFRDLSGDAKVGDATHDEYGTVTVPVTVKNSGQDTYSYSVEVVAESKDGADNYGTASAYAENLTAGQNAKVSADFYDIPDDAVFRVADVERNDY